MKLRMPVRRAFHRASLLALLVLLVLTGCRDAPEGWTTILEQTSSSHLHAEVRRTLGRVTAARRRLRAVTRWFNGSGLSGNAVLQAFALAVVSVAALGVVGFCELMDAAYELFFTIPARCLSGVDVSSVHPRLTGGGGRRLVDHGPS